MLKPLPADRWNYEMAAHLLNRAGFGGTPTEIARQVPAGPEKAVAELVDYEKISDPAPPPNWARPDPERMERLLALRRMNQQARNGSEEERKQIEEKRRQMQREERQKQQEQMQELRDWWLKRMLSGPRPLQEKLTLFWHGHFATSVQKVRDAYLMWKQNDILRQNASGNWLKMLTAVAKDPAMLIWLDQAQSRKEHPNENFAREVMELFALGEGHYTETDITEAARALTGWTLNRLRQEFEYRSWMHDSGIKTVLGRTGALTGSDVLEQIVAQPEAARFIVAKLWTYFAAENPPNDLVDALANVFRRSGNNFKPLLRVMFRAEEFYAPEVVRTQVKSPVQWLIGSVRLLEREMAPPMMTANALRQLGQDLFAPPNVKGWDGGITWITTNNLLNRYNYAAFLVQGRQALPNVMPDKERANRVKDRMARMARRARPVEVGKLFTDEERRDNSKFITALERRFIQAPLRPKQANVLREFLETQKVLTEETVLEAIRLVMSTPDYQLT
jgi:uncharacterized protein (DUF1800 family)